MEINLTGYLAFMGGSVLVCALAYALTLKGNAGLSASRAAALSALTFAVGVPLAFLCARLAYCLMYIRVYAVQGLDKVFTDIHADELSYYGGLAGMCLGMALAARLMGLKTAFAANLFAPAGALLAALARFAEYFLGMLGTGEYLERSFFPVAVEISYGGDWTEYYLAVFMLEGLLSLGAAAYAFFRRGREGCFTRTLFYLCLLQVFCELLRSTTISWLFVPAEQLICYLYVEGVLIAWGVRARGKRRRWAPAVTGLVVCALIVLAEFLLDKTPQELLIKITHDYELAERLIPDSRLVPKWITYTGVLIALAADAAAERFGFHLPEKKG